MARQQAIADSIRCRHERIEDVVNYGGSPLAVRCAVCVDILAFYGECQACKAHGPRYGGTGRQQYKFCDPKCFAEWRSREAKKRAEARKEARK